MKSKKVLSLLLACAVTVSMGTTVFASTEDQIAAAQAQKQEAQAGLAQAQANISGLESKKQELESYLAELNSQYNELTDSISQLSIEAAEKEEELKNVKAQLEVAKQNAQDQYEAMKIRIQYMYEHGGSTMLEMLLSSDNLSDFMNQANNVATISTYDRNMLKKYEETQEALLYCTAFIFGLAGTIVAILGVAVLVTYSVQNGIILLVIAFLVSPMGLPMAAAWLLGKLQALRYTIQDWIYG